VEKPLMLLGARSIGILVFGDKERHVSNRQFLFEYRFGGSDWGISIFASDPSEAKEKIKAVGLARYKGEVEMTIPIFPSLVSWFRSKWGG
jgi:hypothetical protein